MKKYRTNLIDNEENDYLKVEIAINEIKICPYCIIQKDSSICCELDSITKPNSRIRINEEFFDALCSKDYTNCDRIKVATLSSEFLNILL